MLDGLPFAEIWAVDFEFGAEPGENPEPVCLVAWELRSGRRVKIWRDEFGVAPPYPTGPDALFVTYYASAEISCHLALAWPVPERVLDLFTEFRNRTKRRSHGQRRGLAWRACLSQSGRYRHGRKRRNARPGLARRAVVGN